MRLEYRNRHSDQTPFPGWLRQPQWAEGSWSTSSLVKPTHRGQFIHDLKI